MKTQSLTALLAWVLLVPCSHATDVFYKKSLSLYVIHDADQGGRREVFLDRPVGPYAAAGGAAVYIKGTSLYLIRDTRNPKPEFLDQSVSHVQMDGGVIAYLKNNSLYVRRLAEEARASSRVVIEGGACSAFEVKDGKVVFTRGAMSHLYIVTDLDRGATAKLGSAAAEPQPSN